MVQTFMRRQAIGYMYFATTFNGRTGWRQIDGDWFGVTDDFGDFVVIGSKPIGIEDGTH